MAPTMPTITEPTTALRDWLRGLALSVGEDAWAGGLVKGGDLPAIVLWRVGGIIHPDTLTDEGLYQFDCLAQTAVAAAALAGELQTALLQADVPTVLTGDVWLRGWYNLTGRADFDPDPAFQRYIVTAQATTITQPS